MNDLSHIRRRPRRPRISSTMLVAAAVLAALVGGFVAQQPASAAPTPTTPSFSWAMTPRMTGDGVPYGEVSKLKLTTASVSLSCTPVNGAEQYLWSGAGVKTTPPLRAEALEELIGRKRGEAERPRLRCGTTARLPVGVPTTVTLRVRLESGVVTPARSSTIVPRDYLIVSMGDSYASGEGLPNEPQRFDWAGFVSRGPVWSDLPCHRSARSGPSQAAADLERGDPHSTVTFVHIACSGSVIESTGPFNKRGGILSPDTAADHCCRGRPVPSPQIEQLSVIRENAGRPIDALLISGGGNDAGFVPWVMECATDILDPLGPSCIEEKYVSSKYPGKSFTDHVGDALDALPGKLDRLRDRLKSVLGPEAIERTYVAGYPDLLERRSPAGFLLAGITPREAAWASENMLPVINGELAKGRGWKFVDVGPRFVGHGAARGSARWLNWFTDSLITQGPVPRACSLAAISTLTMVGLGGVALAPCAASIVGWLLDGGSDRYMTTGILHPNAQGQRAIADALVEAIRPDLTAYGT
jgi:hypothetical protein